MKFTQSSLSIICSLFLTLSHRKKKRAAHSLLSPTSPAMKTPGDVNSENTRNSRGDQIRPESRTCNLNVQTKNSLIDNTPRAQKSRLDRSLITVIEKINKRWDIVINDDACTINKHSFEAVKLVLVPRFRVFLLSLRPAGDTRTRVIYCPKWLFKLDYFVCLINASETQSFSRRVV